MESSVASNETKEARTCYTHRWEQHLVACFQVISACAGRYGFFERFYCVLIVLPQITALTNATKGLDAENSFKRASPRAKAGV